LIYQGKVKVLSFDAAQRRFNRHTFVDLKAMGFKRFGMPSQVDPVLIENQYSACGREHLGSVHLLLCSLSHLVPEYNILRSTMLVTFKL